MIFKYNMNKKTCKKVIENKKMFVPAIFTERQFEVIRKYTTNDKLTITEKTYLYTSIKKKMQALQLLKEEFYITGKDMISKRVEEAKNILSKINEKAFISGSFLYKENYNDIDIFILSKKRKQSEKEKRHYIYITEKDLKKPMLASAALYSISNFNLPKINVPRKRYGMDNTIMAYQIAISEHMDNEGFKTLKDLIMEYYLIVKNKVLDSYELSKLYGEIENSSNAIEKINLMIKELLLFSYSKRYLYDELVKFTKDFPKLINEYIANENLIVYKKVYDEIKSECRRVKT